MSGACGGFRRALERALEGRAAEEVRVLAWHEHLLGCADCRELLAAEEALEELLASLPEPRLPAALARRVLARLRRERTGENEHERARAEAPGLDRLLALDALAAPAGLAGRVLAGLAHERARADEEQALERLLERLPEPVPPTALAERVLARLAPARASSRRAAGERRHVARPTGARRALLAAAAALFLLLGGTSLWRLARAPLATESELARAERAPSEPPADLLANLDLLVEWEQLVEADVELLLSTLDDEELALLELVAEAPREGGATDRARPRERTTTGGGGG